MAVVPPRHGGFRGFDSLHVRKNWRRRIMAVAPPCHGGFKRVRIPSFPQYWSLIGRILLVWGVVAGSSPVNTAHGRAFFLRMVGLVKILIAYFSKIAVSEKSKRRFESFLVHGTEAHFGWALHLQCRGNGFDSRLLHGRVTEWKSVSLQKILQWLKSIPDL